MTGPQRAEPLRIGVLGAARISDVSLLAPARELGVRLVAVATRDRDRSEAYAAAHGVERVHATYADVIADPEVEAVYNPLPNAAHAPWNLAAIAAGKHVLTEKPGASNAAEARRVQAAADGSGLVVLEGFHWRYHPQYDRLVELAGGLGAGSEIGELQRVDVTMSMPAPGEDDLRWSWPLAGGAMMDLGCYCLHVIRSLSALRGGEPVLLDAAATVRAGRPQLDETFEVVLRLADGTPAYAHVDMDAAANDMSITLTGSRGTARFADFIHPQDDDRLIIDADGVERVEALSRRSTYSYQLAAFVSAVREGVPYPTPPADTVATMALIDACYERAGLLTRQAAA